MKQERTSYPSDVSDEEWAFVAPYSTLMREDAPQRAYPPRELFYGLRWFIRAGAPWRLIPHDLPAWHALYQQTQRWQKVGVFGAMVHDLRALTAARGNRPPRAGSVAGLHFVAFALILLQRLVALMT